jgi:galactokinase
MVRITDAVTGEHVDIELNAALTPVPGSWTNYAITVVRRIARNFPGPLRGAEIAFASDLPPAAGLSSSSALVVSIFLAIADLNALGAHEEYRRAIAGADDLAGYLGAVENGAAYRTLSGDRGVGTFSGSQDQTAILCSRADALVQYSFAPVRFERSVPLPADHVFVIGASGVLAEKTRVECMRCSTGGVRRPAARTRRSARSSIRVPTRWRSCGPSSAIPRFAT